MFQVIITETRRKRVHVDSDHDFQALDAIVQKYSKGEIELTRDNITEVNYEIEEV